MIWPALATFSNWASSDSESWLRFITRRDSVAKGEVSVMPQPWIISTPKVSQYQRIKEGGGAEPPQVSLERLERSYWPELASTRLFTPCQMVGTPADRVTPSSARRPSSRSGAMNRCGMTCLQPSISADQGMPQPMAWNIGTTPRTVSAPERPMESVMHWVRVCRYWERCSYSTPLGLPVVPLV